MQVRGSPAGADRLRACRPVQAGLAALLVTLVLLASPAVAIAVAGVDLFAAFTPLFHPFTPSAFASAALPEPEPAVPPAGAETAPAVTDTHEIEISPAGGVFTSPDGRVRLEAPAGVYLTHNWATPTKFGYDGDGKRITATFGANTTVYIGDYYEKTGATIKTYYSLGGQRVAMRDGSTRYWLLLDHLGSTAVTVNASGSKTGELRYKAYGQNRYSSGATPTTYRFTGQREDATIGLYFYNARYYDPALGRFIQPDTIVPNPAGLLPPHAGVGGRPEPLQLRAQQPGEAHAGR